MGATLGSWLLMREKWAVRLGAIFLSAVIVPSVALVLIAVRAISHEEAYVEKSLEGTLQAEVTHLASQVRGELTSVIQELRGSAPSAFPELRQWEAVSPLVDVPFRLSPEYEILYPLPGQPASEKESLFLEQNRAFLSGEQEVPYYQNIVSLFIDEMPQETGNIQKAATALAKDDALKEQAYEEAEEKGQKALPRTVVPNQSAQATADSDEAPMSIFVSQPRTFQDIVFEELYGIVPRFIQDQLTLIFWTRTDDGGYVGCAIQMDVMRQRIVSLLPEIYSPVRILTILEETGNPLAAPEEEDRDWTRPFVAEEISEILPRWEAAAYLADPGIIASRAERITTIIAVLIGILLVSILSGGALVFKGMHDEISLARKKTTFVANVSHELKTPLTSIRMFAEMLRDRKQDDKGKQRKYLDIMVSESQRLTRLINNVLDFSHPEKARQYHMDCLDVSRLCREIVESQRERLEQSGFTVDFRSGGVLTVKADREAVMQAVLNLISNAEKYSEDSREITVETAFSDGGAVIRVLDRGIGVPQKHRQSIFKEFFRVNDALTSRTRGAGLGLTIASRIVRDHGGKIVYSARSGGGSSFQIRLPLEAAGEEGGNPEQGTGE
jgi:signal transduction histidine kinase